MTAVHLVQMPFASIGRPSIALGQFKAQLAEVGVPARIHHFSLDLARSLGYRAYEAPSP